MKNHTKFLPFALAGFLLFGTAANAITRKIWQADEFVPSENAYFVEEITDEAGLVKAHKMLTPSDPEYSRQKNKFSHGINMVGDLETVWSTYTGKGTTVAIIDDGFDVNHPEYVRQDGTNAILSTSRYYYASGGSAYYKSYSSDPTCIAEDWETTEYGSEWATHGTCTSTTAAAPINNAGGVGIAPDADILALKIDFSFVAIRAAIQYAIDQKVDVINMSLGAYAENFTDGWGETQEGNSDTATYLNSVCQSAYNAGIIVVAAAGNESTWHKSYPACNSKVIGVGALGLWDTENKEDSLAAFTNYVSSNQTGEVNVDILAPGYVHTAHQTGTKNSIAHTYDKTQGTSFSSPIVAGAACLWKEANPSGTPSQFLEKLQATASDIGLYKDKMVPTTDWYEDVPDKGPSNIECGRLNVARLLDLGGPYVQAQESSLSLVVGEDKQVNLVTHYGDISYSIANPNVATVSDTGLVHGAGAGNTTLTITATSQNKTASVEIPITVQGIILTTGMSLAQDSVTIAVGDTFEIEPLVTTTPEDATRLFFYESADTSIASVGDETGILTGVSVGQTTVEIFPVYGSASATLTVNVTQPSGWKRAENSNDLVVGGEYTFGYYTGKTVCAPLAGSYLPTVSATFASESTLSSLPNGAESFTLGKSGNYYTLTQKSNGKLLGYNAKNLTDGTNTTVWTISISNGICSITGGNYDLAYNTSSPRWKTYDSGFTGGAYSLYKKSSAPKVDVTGVSLSKTALTLGEGETETLVATVSPNNATDKSVQWSSDNPQIATVSNVGVITAIKAGSTTIRVSTVDGNFAASCSLTVTTDRYIDHLTATYSGGDLYLGDSLNTSAVTVTATFTDSVKYPDTILSSSDYSLSGFNSETAGSKTITVTYTGGFATSSSPMTTTFSVLVKEDVVTLVSPSVTKLYHPGETIVKADISVTLTFESGKTKTTTNFTFDNDGYRFTYEDTIPGQEATKNFSITYGDSSYPFSAAVAREAYAKATSNGSITGAQTRTAGVTGTGSSTAANYNSLIINGITCSATSIYVYTKDSTDYISFGKGAGEIHNITPLTNPLSDVSLSLKSDSRTDAYIQVSVNGSNWVNKNQANFTTTDYYYFKIGYTSSSGSYSNIQSIDFGVKIDTALTASHFIMAADTEGQCVTKLDQALAKLNAMNQSEAETFWSSQDYVIATARERLEAWAKHQGENLDYVDGAFVLQTKAPAALGTIADNTPAIIIAFVAVLGIASFAATLIAKRKKEH